MAGLLHGLLADPGALADEPRLCALCRFANAVGALTTTARGAIPALPTRERVRSFVDRQPPEPDVQPDMQPDMREQGSQP